MSVTHKFLIGLIMLGVLGYLGLYAGILPTGTTDSAIEELQTAAETSLEKAGIDWARVRMDGQRAILEGTAPSAEAIEEAKDIVLHSTWAGGLTAGGITVVDVSGALDMSSILERDSSAGTVPTASPYTWRAVAEGGRVLLSGYVPSENIRLRMINRAGAFFPDGVIDELQVAQGVPTGDWTGTALIHLAALARLDQGEISARDNVFILTGEAGSDSAGNSARNRLQGIGPEFQSEARISVTPPQAPISANETPDMPSEEILEATAEAARACQSALNVIMRNNTINFRSSSAELLADSLSPLNDVAATLRRCQNFSIEIAGHTDATGDAGANRRLSQVRAEAVLEYLSGQRVPTSRIRARGYGEDQPIAPNETAAGRAQNRRIEFTIIDETQE